MTERIHLGTSESADGTMWYTLIMESPTRFHVEKYNDSKRAFLKDRLTIVPITEFGKHFIDGVSLAVLVADKFREKNFQSDAPVSATKPLPPRNTV